MSEINLEAWKNTKMFSLTLRRWGNRARIKDEGALAAYLRMKNAAEAESVTARAIGEETVQIAKGNGNGSGAKIVSSTKILIKSPALDALAEAMTSLKFQALSFAMPSFVRPGSYIIRNENVEAVDKLLEQGERDFRNEHLPAFLRAYPEAIVSARDIPVKSGGLGPLWREEDYPSTEQLRGKFSIRWQWFTLTVPEGLPPEVRERETKKLQEQFEEAAREVRDALRTMFAKLIDRAVERLTVAPGEKPKTFRDSLIANIGEFFDTFEARNIMQDADLAALVAKAREVMTGVEAEKLRSDEEFRTATAAKLETINDALAPMVEEIQERAFDFTSD